MDPWKWTMLQGVLREQTWKIRAKAQPMYTRRQDMEGTTWPIWREPQAPGHLCVWLRLTWSGGIRKVSQNWPSKMRSGIVHHKSDRKPCLKPTAVTATSSIPLNGHYLVPESFLGNFNISSLYPCFFFFLKNCQKNLPGNLPETTNQFGMV